MNTVYLEKNQVPAHLIGGYKGQKFQFKVAERVTLQNTYWSGGTKSNYALVNLSNGSRSPIAQDSAPMAFGKDRDGTTIDIKPGYAVLERCTFQGKDMGMAFTIHPDNAAKLLPVTDSNLTDAELCLLEATGSLKGSYGGRKPRIDMMHNNGFSDSDIETAKTSLIDKKMLRGNGSITPLGRNNRPQDNQFKSY